jgi:hypothetical protein
MIAGRPRDIEDIESVLIENPKYDKKYIENWLEEFDRSLSGNFFVSFMNVEKNIS